MLTMRIENWIFRRIAILRGYLRSLLLFGKHQRVKLGKGVKVSGEITFGYNITISDYSTIRGSGVWIKDDVHIHENVLIRGRDSLIIGRGTTINRNTSILDRVTIGDYCSVAPNCVIVGSNHVYRDKRTRIKDQGSSFQGIVIGDDVWIAANVTVVDGVTIGDGAVVAAGAVVTKSVAPFKVVAGVPAKVVGERS